MNLGVNSLRQVVENFVWQEIPQANIRVVLADQTVNDLALSIFQKIKAAHQVKFYQEKNLKREFPLFRLSLLNVAYSIIEDLDKQKYISTAQRGLVG